MERYGKARFVLLAAGVVIVSIPFLNAAAQKPTPTQVVEKYLEMVERGDLLTSAGWSKVSILFSSPSPKPERNTVFVTSKHAGVGEMWEKEDRAEVHDAWWDPQGSIDANLRYSPPPPTEAKASIGIYHLICQDGEWKIEGGLTHRWTTTETAIRYVEKMREQTNDPRMKQNADRTLMILRKYLRR